MQWAGQHDSIRTNCDNLPPVHSLARNISEGENKLQVVMARGLLNQAINFSFVNALVRGKNIHLLACSPLWSPAGNGPRLISPLCFSMQINKMRDTVMAALTAVKDTDCRASKEFGPCSYKYFRLRSNAQYSIIFETNQTKKNPMWKFN